MSSVEERLEAYYGRLRERNLGPLWNSIGSIMTKEPHPRAVPYLWRWSEVRAFAMEAGELVTPERGGERRVVFFMNPGCADLAPWGWGSATDTLYAGIQLLLPGEKAPSHRHNQSAIRFIVEGSGACTIVEGSRIHMEPGDFLITPPGLWHDHVHDGHEPMLWLDSLDIPMLYKLGAMFFEHHPEYNQPVTLPDDESLLRYRAPGLRPLQDRDRTYAPLAVFKWERTRETLDALEELPPDPHDGYAVEYVNPATGEAAGKTIGAMMQKLPPGFRTQAHRHVHSSVYHVFAGEGATVINGVTFRWHKGDTFVIPNWAWHEHMNLGDGPAYLFSTNDRPVMERLGLERIEAHPEGQQQPQTEFEG